MPEINEIRQGFEVGIKGKTASYARYIFSACVCCGKGRWVTLCDYKTGRRNRCASCGALGYYKSLLNR
jgi:hypothetical protein